jgi:hypothetical protein
MRFISFGSEGRFLTKAREILFSVQGRANTVATFSALIMLILIGQRLGTTNFVNIRIRKCCQSKVATVLARGATSELAHNKERGQRNLFLIPLLKMESKVRKTQRRRYVLGTDPDQNGGNQNQVRGLF